MPAGEKSQVWLIQRGLQTIPERIVLDKPYYKREARRVIRKLKGWVRLPVNTDIYMPYNKEDRDGTESSD